MKGRSRIAFDGMRAMDTEVNRVVRKQLVRIVEQLDRSRSICAYRISVDHFSLMSVWL